MIEWLSTILEKVETVYKTVKYVIYEKSRLIHAEVKKFEVGYKILSIPTDIEASKIPDPKQYLHIPTIIDLNKYEEIEAKVNISDDSTMFKDHKKEAILSYNIILDVKPPKNTSSHIHNIYTNMTMYKHHHKYKTLYLSSNKEVSKFQYKDYTLTFTDTSEANKIKDIGNANSFDDTVTIDKMRIVDKEAPIISYAIVEKQSREPIVIPSPIIIRSVKTPSNILILR